MKNFTNLYQLSKTLRFELKPEPATKAKFEEWLSQINDETIEIKADNLFAKDKAIYEAYIALKPILDKIHEEFITISLQSDQAKDIDFGSFFSEYSKQGNLDSREKELRSKIGECYSVGYNILNDTIGKKNKEIEEEFNANNKKCKPTDLIIFKKTDEKCLKEEAILTYIKCFPSDFISDSLTEDKLIEHIDKIKGFKGYLDGYNTNRSNYYEVTTEKSTAVATRIVHENLPTFCDNIIRFNKRKDDYLNAYQYLQDNNRTTQIKDAKTEKMREAEEIKDSVFEISHFNECLSQPQIEEYNRIIGNYNLLINLYNQARNQDNGFKKLVEFEKLYKQIGCGTNNALFISIQKDKEDDLTNKERNSNDILSAEKLILLTANAGQKIFTESRENTGEIKTVPDFINWLRKNDNWDGIYWSKSAVTKISNLYFANWHDLKDRLKGNKACVSYDKNREEQIKLNDAIELSGLFSVINQDEPKLIFKQSVLDDETYKTAFDKNNSSSKSLINLICNDIEKNINYFLKNIDEIKSLKKYKEGKQEEGREDEIIGKIKNWFDAANDAIRIVKYFAVRKSKMKGNTANTAIEQALQNILYADDVDWSKWYDAIRNYLTKKPQDDVKDNMLKLNFGKGNLLNGFSDSHTDTDNGTQYGGYIFRKMNIFCNEYEYYLGISSNAKLFRCYLKNEIQEKDKSEYERFDYYQMKPSTPYPNSYEKNKQDIRCIIKELTENIVKNNQELKDAAEKINKVDKEGNVTPAELFKRLEKSNEFKSLLTNQKLEMCINDTIKNIKDNCKKLSRIDEINELQQIDHNGVKGFCLLINSLGEIAKKAKLFDFFHVSKQEFDKAMKDDKKPLFLFKISNKDLSYCETFENGKRKKKDSQKENLHTLFFRALMRETKYEKCNYIDIGTGQIFFRKKAYSYDEETIKNGHHHHQLKEKFKYPIISNKRFSEDKYQLHLSVSLYYTAKNYKSPKNSREQNAYNEVNKKINDELQKNGDLYYMGIDRGEKHLVYICVVDKDGKIIKCTDYDIINGTNYVQKLEDKALYRKQARQNWQTIGNIKNLKEGYISHAVHKIVTEILNNPSYIIMEDLNTGMKRGRQKIEKQIYQKFETALASKLNFVVDKDAQFGEVASIEEPLQLTPPIANYQDIEGKKQFGIMLYTRANYTSVTDPATGWRKTIYLKSGNENEIKKQILDKFSDIGFDGTDYFFEYNEINAGKKWRLYSGKNGKPLPRFKNSKAKKENYDRWVPEFIDVVSILNKLFKDFDKESSLYKQLKEGKVLSKIEGQKETAWESLRFAIDSIQQIRNTGIDAVDDNFLYSPVRNEQGIHFDSRLNKDKENSIKDGDANGAFNIARKGLIMDAHIKYSQAKNNNNDDLDLFISDKEWDLWLLNREEWKKQLPSFALKTAKEKIKE